MTRPGRHAGRHLVTGIAPTATAGLFVLVLVWAGAPQRDVSARRAWAVVGDLRPAGWLGIATGLLVFASLLLPLQPAMLRLLAGQWTPHGPLGALARIRAEVHENRRARWAGILAETRSVVTRSSAVASGTRRAGRSIRAELAAAEQKAAQFADRLRRHYPPDSVPARATALGNALVAAERSAGQPYGLDADVAWPRLYHCMGASVRHAVQERRSLLDMAVRTCVTWLGACLATVGILLTQRDPAVLLLGLVPLTVAALAYLGAVQAAIGYGHALRVAFDLHHLDLLTALQLPRPADAVQERQLNEALSRFWRHGVPMNPSYAPGTGGGDLGAAVRAALLPETPVSFQGAVTVSIDGARPEGAGPHGRRVWRLSPAQGSCQVTIGIETGAAAFRAGGVGQLPGSIGQASVAQVPGGVGQVPGGVGQVPGGVAQVPGGVGQVPGRNHAEIRRQLNVAGGRRAATVQLDVDIDMPFVVPAPAAGEVTLPVDGGRWRMDSAVHLTHPGEYDLRVSVYSSGRLVQAVPLTIVAVRAERLDPSPVHAGRPRPGSGPALGRATVVAGNDRDPGRMWGTRAAPAAGRDALTALTRPAPHHRRPAPHPNRTVAAPEPLSPNGAHTTNQPVAHANHAAAQATDHPAAHTAHQPAAAGPPDPPLFQQIGR